MENQENENIVNVENVENLEPEFSYPDKMSEMTGYEHLHFMCKNVRNTSNSAKGYLNPMTERLQYIMSALSSHCIPFEYVPFDAFNQDGHADGAKLANIIVKFDVNPELDTVIFSAHHDIANPNSENCQDNTASVANLIHLATKLTDLQKEGRITRNVVIAFTDCEEIGGRGMNQLARECILGKYGNMENITLYALELTAGGEKWWVSGIRNESPMHNTLQERLGEDVATVSTPYNESVNSRRFGINSCCIGILPDNELTIAKARSFCPTWMLCHSMTDTFEKSANKEDMNNFVDGMLKLIEINEVEEIINEEI